MPIISVRDNDNNRWNWYVKTTTTTTTTTATTTTTTTKTGKNKGDRSYSKRVRTTWFFCGFKVGFLQLICKSSLIFKSNLELSLSIILRQRELYESKHVAVECRYLKIRDLLSFLICSSILVLKWWQVSSI